MTKYIGCAQVWTPFRTPRVQINASSPSRPVFLTHGGVKAVSTSLIGSGKVQPPSNLWKSVRVVRQIDFLLAPIPEVREAGGATYPIMLVATICLAFPPLRACIIFGFFNQNRN